MCLNVSFILHYFKYVLFVSIVNVHTRNVLLIIEVEYILVPVVFLIVHRDRLQHHHKYNIYAELVISYNRSAINRKFFLQFCLFYKLIKLYFYIYKIIWPIFISADSKKVMKFSTKFWREIIINISKYNLINL